MSGLRFSSASVPNELKSEMRPAVGIGVNLSWSVHVSVDAPGSPAKIAAPSAAVIAATGTVIGGEPIGTGATVGFSGPAALLLRPTAIGPALLELDALT